MRRNIFKITLVALFILLCPVTVKAEIIREVASEECAPNLPERIHDIIEQEECKIYEVTADDENVPSDAVGVYTYSVFIEEGYLDYAVYHEIGHFYDYYTLHESDTKTFQKIFDDEKDSFIANIRNYDYYLTSTDEYFAESFSCYCKDPVKLQTYLPQTYAYIDKKVNDPICRGKDITETAVGEECNIDISDYLPYVTSITCDTAEDPHAFLYVSGTDVYVKGISKGKTLYTLHGPNNTYMTINCKVPGKPTKQKKYNNFNDVISEVFGYKNLCLINPHSNELSVLAQSVGDRDLTITFYDYDKKKVGTYKLTNEAKSGDDYEFISSLKIPKKKFNKIEYYRIGVI